MPLTKGRSKKVRKKNVNEMVASYKHTGKIGPTHPKNLQHAYQIATAAAHQKAGTSRKKKKGKGK